MSRKTARQQIGVALFPFLAVLICTMGALIVLLVLRVRQGRVDATTIAVAQIGGGASGEEKERRERLEDAQWQRELLEKSRAEKSDELTQARARVAHLEEHTQRLEAQARELLERARAIDEGKQLRAEDLTAARAEADRLKKEIEKKKKELDEAKKKAGDGQEWYALIPYDGRSGTRRRPIYVECTEFGVIIQPEGLLLRAEDFNGPLGPGNPLDSALRAIRDHWERTAGDKAAQPYPLLVVRPSGVIAFDVAAHAIRAWDDEWGYELISDDKQLDFGPPDPALDQVVTKTLAVARQRQAAMVAMMPRTYERREPLTSFAPEAAIRAGGGPFVGSAGAAGGTGSALATGAGRGSSGNNGAGNSGFGNGYGTTSAPGLARGSGNGLVGGSGLNGNTTGGVGSGASSGSGTGAFAGGGIAGGSSWGSGGANVGAGPRGATATGGASSTGAGFAASGAPGAPGTSGSGSGGSGTGGSGTGAIGSNTPGAGGWLPTVTANEAKVAPPPALRFSNTIDNSGTGNGSGGGTGNGSGAGDTFPYSSTAGSDGGGSGFSQGGGGIAGGGPAGGGPALGSPGGGSPANASSAMAAGRSMPMGSSTVGGNDEQARDAAKKNYGPFVMDPTTPGSAAGPMDAATSGGAPGFNHLGSNSSDGMALRGGSWGSTYGVDATKMGKPPSTTKRGNNWALPQAKPHETGVTRPMRVSIEPDRVVLVPERGDDRPPQVVKIAPNLSLEDVNHVVSAVQNEVKGWGLVVSHGYWKPVLQAEVAPGAEQHFENLQMALKGSGIDIVRK